MKSTVFTFVLAASMLAQQPDSAPNPSATQQMGCCLKAEAPPGAFL
jgi:hypothetical protein